MVITIEELLDGYYAVETQYFGCKQEIRICDKEWPQFMEKLWNASHSGPAPADWFKITEATLQGIPIVRTPIEEYDAPYVLPHIYAWKDDMVIGVFVHINGSLTQLPPPSNDKHMVALRKRLMS